MKRQIKGLLLAAVVIPCMLITAACGGHKHSWAQELSKNADYHWYECGCGGVKDKSQHDWDAGVFLAGDAPTLEAGGTKTFTCKTDGCGQTKTEAVAKRTPLFASAEAFIEAVLDGEGNFSASMEFTEQDSDGDSSAYSAIFKVDGIYSYVEITDADDYINQEYDEVLGEGSLGYYYRYYDDEGWSEWDYNSGDYETAFLYYAEIEATCIPNIYTVDILRNGTFAKDASNSNKYTYGDEDYLCVIEISADKVILTITAEYIYGDYEASGTAVYTFNRFGTTHVEIPEEAAKVKDAPLFVNAEDFIEAVLDSEGNFSAEMVFTEQDNDGDSSAYSAIFKVDGIYSYVELTYADDEIVQEYNEVLGEGSLGYYYRYYYGESWGEWVYDSGSFETAFLYYAEIEARCMPDIDTVDILRNGTFVKDAGNSNKYTYGDEDYLCVIEISADKVTLTITAEYIDGDYEASGTAVYTFDRFGTTYVEIPEEALEQSGGPEDDTVRQMFGIEPDYFYESRPYFMNETPQWTWQGDKYSEIHTFLASKGFTPVSNGMVAWDFDKNSTDKTIVCICEDRLVVAVPSETFGLYAVYYAINESENLVPGYFDGIAGVSYNDTVELYSSYTASWDFYGETDRTDDFKQILIDTGEWELDTDYNYSGSYEEGGDAYTSVYIIKDKCYIHYAAANGDFVEIKLVKTAG